VEGSSIALVRDWRPLREFAAPALGEFDFSGLESYSEVEMSLLQLHHGHHHHHAKCVLAAVSGVAK